MNQVDTTDTTDNLLKVYAYFRAFLSATLLIMYLSDMGLNVLGNTYPQIYLGTTSAYLAISLLTLLHFHFNQAGPSIQLLFFMLLTDMVATTIIMHSSGGLSSGLGFLMLIIVAAGSILLTGRWSLLIAALASICILTETLSTTLLACVRLLTGKRPMAMSISPSSIGINPGSSLLSGAPSSISS